MRKFLIILLFLFFKIGISQQPNNGIDFSSDRGKIYYESLHNQLTFFALENIQKTKGQDVIRFWNTTNCIEIRKSGNDLQGKVIFAIQNTEKNNEFLRENINLDQNQINSILNLMKYYKISGIATYEQIVGWTSGFDGDLFQIESNINNNYQLKTYWTPSIQQAVPEAKIIDKFIYGIDKIIKIDSLFQDFIKENKFVCYRYYGTAYSVCSILTKKQKRINKRLKRRQINNQ
ncbi:hypothetical protein [Halpernia sp. GG3]